MKRWVSSRGVAWPSVHRRILSYRNMTIDQHVTLAARLWIIYSALILIGSFTGTMFFLVLDRHDSAAGESLFLSLVSLPGIAGGIALFKRRSWARMLLLILAFLRLVSFPPIGTALGGYTIWLLFKKRKTAGSLTN